MSKVALILGIGGQDGSYLAEVLLAKGYEVHGLYRRSSQGNLKNIEHIKDEISLHKGDLLDISSIDKAISESQCTHLFNEADQDNVGWSYHLPEYAYNVTSGAVSRILELLRTVYTDIRFFQPVSSTMFGDPCEVPQTEDTQFDPQSPYACAKCHTYYLCRYYRESHGIFVSTGILYNHDSPRRTEDYLLQKICRSVIRIFRGQQKKLLLGNLHTRLDLGYALEYMQAVSGILDLDEPNDFIIATGESYTIEEYVNFACEYFNIWPLTILGIDPKYYQEQIPTMLQADCTKLKNAIDWKPRYTGRHLVRTLIQELQERMT